MKSKYINSIVIILIIILIIQAIWLSGMYSAYMEEYKQTVNSCLSQAADIELTIRQYQEKVPFQFSLEPKSFGDTSRIITRRLQTEDTTIFVKVDKFQPHLESQMHQFGMKGFAPLNINVLDSVFYSQLQKSRFSVKQTYVEYIDIDEDSIISTNKPSFDISGFYETPVLPLDILNSIGVKGYTKKPVSAILKNMAIQLTLSAILITIVCIYLFKILQTIFLQRKEAIVKRDFINAMTHEFRRPITSALFQLGYAIELSNTEKKERMEKYIKNACFDIEKLELYTTKIQEINRGEAGKAIIKNTEIHLDSFLNEIKNKFEKEQKKKVNIRLDVVENIKLYTDPVHFANIMDNLIENSIKYSNDPVNITITTEKIGAQISITAKDDGWGIPSSEIGYIFDKFYRGNSRAKRKQNGFGLGLSYVKTIMTEMGGKISVNSQVEKYTEFKLIFPEK